ncbi:MAG: hypothetical protein ABFE13_16885 [Phycisphaerales bacterium]
MPLNGIVAGGLFASQTTNHPPRIAEGTCRAGPRPTRSSLPHASAFTAFVQAKETTVQRLKHVEQVFLGKIPPLPAIAELPGAATKSGKPEPQEPPVAAVRPDDLTEAERIEGAREWEASWRG